VANNPHRRCYLPFLTRWVFICRSLQRKKNGFLDDRIREREVLVWYVYLCLFETIKDQEGIKAGEEKKEIRVMILCGIYFSILLG